MTACYQHRLGRAPISSKRLAVRKAHGTGAMLNFGTSPTALGHKLAGELISATLDGAPSGSAA